MPLRVSSEQLVIGYLEPEPQIDLGIASDALLHEDPLVNDRTVDEIYGFTPEVKDRREEAVSGQFNPTEAAFMARKIAVLPSAETGERRAIRLPQRKKLDRKRLSCIGKMLADGPPPHVMEEIHRMRGY